MRTLNRSIALAVVPILARLPITPNAVTVASLASGLAAAWCFSHGATGWIAGALWLQLSFVLDNCDGSLARLTNRFSGFGSWLDTISDCVVNMGFFYGLGLGLYRDSGKPFWLAVATITSIGVLFSYAGSFAAEVARRGPEAWRHPDPPRAQDGTLVGLRKRAREDFSWIVLGAAFTGHVAWLLWCGLVSSYLIGAAGVRTVLRAQGAARAPAVPGSRDSTVESPDIGPTARV
jgi:phosphatidylglycerophosphate synthase